MTPTTTETLTTLKRYYVTTKFEKYGTYTFMARSEEHARELFENGDYGFDNYTEEFGEYNEVIEEIEEEIIADTQLTLSGLF